MDDAQVLNPLVGAHAAECQQREPWIPREQYRITTYLESRCCRPMLCAIRPVPLERKASGRLSRFHPQVGSGLLGGAEDCTAGTRARFRRTRTWA